MCVGFPMSALKDPRIEALQRQAGDSGELDFIVGEGCFRINLRDENIVLWRDTLNQQSRAVNLLLACDQNSGDLDQAQLTWVVGSAIRGTTTNSTNAITQLLQQMGVGSALTDEAAKRCPGLGEDLVWAFYLERHGWLIATPVAQTTHP